MVASLCVISSPSYITVVFQSAPVVKVENSLSRRPITNFPLPWLGALYASSYLMYMLEIFIYIFSMIFASNLSIEDGSF